MQHCPVERLLLRQPLPIAAPDQPQHLCSPPHLPHEFCVEQYIPNNSFCALCHKQRSIYYCWTSFNYAIMAYKVVRSQRDTSICSICTKGGCTLGLLCKCIKACQCCAANSREDGLLPQRIVSASSLWSRSSGGCKDDVQDLKLIRFADHRKEAAEHDELYLQQRR